MSESIERVVTVVPEAGLHARPATTFVETAREFDADVTVGRTDGDQVSAETMLGVTGLGVECGEEVRLVADGPDAEAALDALEEVLTTPEEGDEGTESDPDEGDATDADDRPADQNPDPAGGAGGTD